MTGYVNSGHNPTSMLTIASLQDLGYDVDYTKAGIYNGYNMNNLLESCCRPDNWESYIIASTTTVAPTSPATQAAGTEAAQSAGTTAAPQQQTGTSATQSAGTTAALQQTGTTAAPQASSKSSKSSAYKNTKKKEDCVEKYTPGNKAGKERCKKKNLSWEKTNHARQRAMKKLRQKKLKKNKPRTKNGVTYVGDKKISLLVEEDGTLFEVEVDSDGNYVVSEGAQL